MINLTKPAITTARMTATLTARTDAEICAICADVIAQANAAGNDWTTPLDRVLTAAGIKLGEQPDGSDSREVVRLADGRIVRLHDESQQGAGRYIITQVPENSGDDDAGEPSGDMISPANLALARKLYRAANDEGTIQAVDMRRIAPHNRPELHTTMRMSHAYEALTGQDWAEVIDLMA